MEHPKPCKHTIDGKYGRGQGTKEDQNKGLILPQHSPNHTLCLARSAQVLAWKVRCAPTSIGPMDYGPWDHLIPTGVAFQPPRVHRCLRVASLDPGAQSCA